MLGYINHKLWDICSLMFANQPIDFSYCMVRQHPAQNANTQRHGQPAHLRGVSLCYLPSIISGINLKLNRQLAQFRKFRLLQRFRVHKKVQSRFVILLVKIIAITQFGYILGDMVVKHVHCQFLKLVRTQYVRTNGFRAGVDLVATKLGIIVSSSSSSFHLLFPQKGFAQEVEIWGVT